jgi:hypothetical protein
VLPDSPTKARFLSHDEKIIALERLRANNQVSPRLLLFFSAGYEFHSRQGTEAKVWKWDQVFLLLGVHHFSIKSTVGMWRCSYSTVEIFPELRTSPHNG